MSGRSAAKTAVYRRKAPTRVQLNDPLPADFLGFLFTLPPNAHSHDATGDGEPLLKRTRTQHVDAVPIAREFIALDRPIQHHVPITGSFLRLNVHRHIKIHFEEVSNTLTISADGRSGFKSELELGRRQFTNSELAVLKVLSQSREDENEEGAVWIRTTITLERKTNDLLRLGLELNWNSSSTHSLRNKSQRALSQQVLDTFFEGNTVADSTNESEKLSSRAFYDATFIPKDNTRYESHTVANLNPSLFPFQRRALEWLLNREGVSWKKDLPDGWPCLEQLSLPSTTRPPFSFSIGKDADAKSVYVSHLYHVVIRDPTPFDVKETDIKGGILAEEMGLGKTVETISLICTHTRGNTPSINDDTTQNKRLSRATLIVTPHTLKDQWVSEFGKHAPNLRMMVYEGLKELGGENEGGLVSKLAEHDVVITTYKVLQGEIHFAQEPPSRSFRHARKRQRIVSPLMQICWWRVCLDEAQEIESGTRSAAKLVKSIPRVNAWGITGTPVKEDINDLWGLLSFLRYEPYASSPAIWEGLVTSHQDLFIPLFSRITLRHTKRLVRDEVTLPPQERYVITVPFTAVEEQHYRQRSQHLVKWTGLDENGLPDQETWAGREGPREIFLRMAHALAQLRRIILHPSLETSPIFRNGDLKGKLVRTLDEVLTAMIHERERIIKSNQWQYFSAKVERGQLLAHNPATINEAMAIWQGLLEEIKTAEKECRFQLQVEVEKDAKSGNSKDKGSDLEIYPTRITNRNHLKLILNTHHRALFFLASAYFQLKSDAETMGASPEQIKEMEVMEDSGYEAAKTIRQEILHETREKALSNMGTIRDKATTQSFVEVPEINWSPSYGIEDEAEQALKQLSAYLNEQAKLMDKWRESIVDLLLRPLVDTEEMEATGDEYSNSIQVQDDLMVYTMGLRCVIADRHYALSGLENERVKREFEAAERKAEEGQGSAPTTVRKLSAERNRVKLSFGGTSLRSVILEIREFSSTLRSSMAMSKDVGGSQTKMRFEQVEESLCSVQKHSSAQTKAVTRLERELDGFVSTMNARVVYYRQFQAVSDTVRPLDMNEINVRRRIRQLLSKEQDAQRRITTAQPNYRYLLNLKESGADGADADNCIICQASFTTGVLTDCGHRFCKECLNTWLQTKNSCPMCKSRLPLSSIHDITLKKRESKILQEDLQVSGPSRSHTKKSRSSGIYSQLSNDKLEAIKSITLDGPSSGTKIDSLARHLIWLREGDPGAKSVIFSQFGEFLEVLSEAFDQQNIAYTSFQKADGIKRFKEDAAIECFLMDARAHASGLNLVNASHVFLCEPLLNTALEQQAIARVHRIGQQRDTTVWLYLVDGTVEGSVYDLSVQRRREHLGKNANGETRSRLGTSPTDSLELANSRELEAAGAVSKLITKNRWLGRGEVVDDNDLWQCLFGHVAKANASTDDMDERP